MSGGLTDYYRRFPGDYRKDTCHLTLEEHGAYALLLDHCYSTESPILSISAAYKICSAVSKRERNSAKKVLEEFFEFTDVGYINNRVQKEISYADSISLVRRRAAEIKHKKHANAQQMQVQIPAIPDNQTTRQPELQKKEAPAVPPIIPITLWLAFVEMREKTRHPLTNYAGEIIRKKLEEFAERGFDPIEILETSIANNWKDVFEPKAKEKIYESFSERNQRKAADAIGDVRRRAREVLSEVGTDLPKLPS